MIVKCNAKNHIIKDVPLTHVIKHKSYVGKLENQAQKWCNLEKVRTKNIYSGDPIGWHLFGAAGAIAPHLSLHKLQFIIHLIIAAHYHDAGLEINTKDLCKSLPSANTLRECIIDVTIDNIIQLRNELNVHV